MIYKGFHGIYYMFLGEKGFSTSPFIFQHHSGGWILG
jgi:hypothetical protein